MEVRYTCTYILIIVLELFDTFFGSNVGLRGEFEKSNICAEAYGSEIAYLVDVPGSISCASLCSNVSDCASCIYNPISQVCSLNTHRLENRLVFSCTSHVSYSQKSLCVEGNKCTYPLKNTRLCDGTSAGQCDASRGRLEVFLNNQWGTVCDDFWRDEFSTEYPNELVACRMYGFNTGIAVREAFYGTGTGSILLDDVTCSGNESSILNCPFLQPVGTNNCDHDEDVGVSCY